MPGPVAATLSVGSPPSGGRVPIQASV